MKRIHSRLLLFLTINSLLFSCCEFTTPIEYEFKASRRLFQPSQVIINFEDSTGNAASLMYYNEDCEFSEWEIFEGTSDNGEVSRS